MGVENNEAILATTWDNKSVEKVKKWIKEEVAAEWQELFVFASSIANGKTTIVLAPDGSKKGSDIAEFGGHLRNDFISLLSSLDHEDGSNPFDWVEVGYGEFGQKVLRGNCKNQYGYDEYCME